MWKPFFRAHRMIIKQFNGQTVYSYRQKQILALYDLNSIEKGSFQPFNRSATFTTGDGSFSDVQNVQSFQASRQFKVQSFNVQ
jgi:hypothetical protein